MPAIEPPDRAWRVGSSPGINVVEWGPSDGPPLGLVHGGGDFARSFDGFAPLLARAGWRVCAWDQRGHGDSDRTALYSLGADLRDAVAVLEAIGGGEPLMLLGHSKGSVLAIELTAARPDLVAAVVALDGFTRRRGWTGSAAEAAARWCDGRRRARQFRPGTLQALAERRAAQNPRVGIEWATHLVTVGAAQGEDGLWRWKLDPAAYPPPPHAWPREASLAVLGHVARPLLALKAGIEEEMAGQLPIEVLRAHLPPAGQLQVLDGVGHFAHVEEPERVAERVLNFFPSPVT